MFAIAFLRLKTQSAYSSLPALSRSMTDDVVLCHGRFSSPLRVPTQIENLKSVPCWRTLATLPPVAAVVRVRRSDLHLHGRAIVKGEGQQVVRLASAADGAPGDDLGELLVAVHGKDSFQRVSCQCSARNDNQP